MNKNLAQFLTINLKLHKPSKHKAALIFQQMRKATLARANVMQFWEKDADFQSALTEAMPKAEVKKLANQLVAGIKRDHPAIAPVINGLRDGVVEDCAMMIKSRLRLLAEHDDKAGAADLLPRPSGFEAGLAALVESRTEEEYNAARDLMSTRAQDDLRPLRFTRWRGHDGFRLLGDDQGRIWIALPLGSTPQYREDTKDAPQLFDMRTGEVAKLPGRTVLYPVDCGRWQMERILSGAPKSAILSFKNGVFTLHVSVAIPIERRAFDASQMIGVDRGIDVLAAVVAARLDGAATSSHIAEGETLRSLQRRAEARAKHSQKCGRDSKPLSVRRSADVIIHETSRAIVDLAQKHGAVVALEELSNISNGPKHRREKGARRPKALNRQLSRAQYGKLEHQVRYKMRLAGLIDCYDREAVVTVFAGGTSQTCAECSHKDKANRKTREDFKCTKCGHAAHADVNAARNIAQRGFNAVERMRAKAAEKGRTLFPASLLEESRTTAPGPGYDQLVQNVRQGSKNSGSRRNVLRAESRFFAKERPKFPDIPRGLVEISNGLGQNAV
jgi:IS605 OrfB family transposase